MYSVTGVQVTISKTAKKKTPKHNIYRHLKLIVLNITDKAAEDVATGDNVIQLLRGRATLSQDLLETSDLLGGVALVLAELFGSLNIVLSVLVLKTLSSLLDLNSKLVKLLSCNVLRHNLVQRGDGTGDGVEATTGGTVSAGLLVDELDEGLLGASAGVVLGLGGALGEELDGRVSGDALFLGQGTGVLGFGIDLGDNDVGLAGVVIGEGLPGGGEALAV